MPSPIFEDTPGDNMYKDCVKNFNIYFFLQFSHLFFSTGVYYVNVSKDF